MYICFMKKIQIYILIDPITKIVRYVGKSVNAKRRYNQHLYDKRHDNYSSRWIRKLQKQNLKPFLEIIEECDESVWQERERYWISYYKPISKLTNLTAGGDGLSFYSHSEITKRKISEKHKGKLLSENTKNKIRNFNLGKKESKETKNKKSESSKNFYNTTEGKILSKKLVENMIKATKKAVVQLTLDGNFVKEYESLSDAYRDTGFSVSKISLVCNNKRQKAYGFKWKFKK